MVASSTATCSFQTGRAIGTETAEAAYQRWLTGGSKYDDTLCRLDSLCEQARKPRSYASSELRPNESVTDVTGVKCRATSVANIWNAHLLPSTTTQPWTHKLWCAQSPSYWDPYMPKPHIITPKYYKLHSDPQTKVSRLCSISHNNNYIVSFLWRLAGRGALARACARKVKKST